MKATGKLANIVTILLLCCSGCTLEQRTQRTRPAKPALRFQEIDDVVVFGKSQRATIYEDTQTGVQYLYVWSGAANGGPAITRLWDE